MLLYQPLEQGRARHLAELLAEEDRLERSRIDDEVAFTIERLQTHFGKRVVVSSAARSA